MRCGVPFPTGMDEIKRRTRLQGSGLRTYHRWPPLHHQLFLDSLSLIYFHFSNALIAFLIIRRSANLFLITCLQEPILFPMERKRETEKESSCPGEFGHIHTCSSHLSVPSWNWSTRWHAKGGRNRCTARRLMTNIRRKGDLLDYLAKASHMHMMSFDTRDIIRTYFWVINSAWRGKEMGRKTH